jgi:hypothetical protein
MDFAAVISYLAVYYVRPQEWSPVLSFLHPVTVVMAFAIASLVLREGGVQFRNILRGPIDWLMLLYFLYLTFVVDSESESYNILRNHFIIYFCTVQALTNLDRLRKYLYWWAACIGFVVLLALVSQIGIDPLGAKYYTTFVARGRLALPLSVFDNPNALGHSVVPLLAMLYFFLIWRRPVFVKEIGAVVMILPLICIYLTLSKGAFMSAFVAIAFGLMVGRPKIWQVIVVALALTAGWGAMQKLPRMKELNMPRHEEGIQGRLNAWKWGMEKMKVERYGIGILRFAGDFQRDNGYFKAPHSSYVEAGTEQGFVGLMFFVGVIYACLRTLLGAKVTDPEEERFRRVLLVLVVAFAASSWMIGWAYKTFFFLIAACVSAYYRQLLVRVLQESELAEDQEEVKALAQVPILGGFEPLPALGTPATAMRSTSTGMEALAMAPAPKTPADEVQEKTRPKFWYHLGVLDLCLIYAAARGAVWFWAYVVRNM